MCPLLLAVDVIDCEVLKFLRLVALAPATDRGDSFAIQLIWELPLIAPSFFTHIELERGDNFFGGRDDRLRSCLDQSADLPGALARKRFAIISPASHQSKRPQRGCRLRPFSAVPGSDNSPAQRTRLGSVP